MPSLLTFASRILPITLLLTLVWLLFASQTTTVLSQQAATAVPRSLSVSTSTSLPTSTMTVTQTATAIITTTATITSTARTAVTATATLTTTATLPGPSKEVEAARWDFYKTVLAAVVTAIGTIVVAVIQFRKPQVGSGEGGGIGKTILQLAPYLILGIFIVLYFIFGRTVPPPATSSSGSQNDQVLNQRFDRIEAQLQQLATSVSVVRTPGAGFGGGSSGGGGGGIGSSTSSSPVPDSGGGGGTSLGSSYGNGGQSSSSGFSNSTLPNGTMPPSSSSASLYTVLAVLVALWVVTILPVLAFYLVRQRRVRPQPQAASAPHADKLGEMQGRASILRLLKDLKEEEVITPEIYERQRRRLFIDFGWEDAPSGGSDSDY